MSDLKKIDQSQKDRKDLLTLSNGIVLMVSRVPATILVDVMAEVRRERPKPPVHYIERLGREEENPSDPDYIEAMESFKLRQAKIVGDAFLAAGTKLWSCPEGMPKPDDKDADWLENMRILNINIPDGRRGRYLMWLKAVALVEQDDYAKVMEEVGRKSGVRETDVQSAAESFRGDESGHPDPESQSAG